MGNPRERSDKNKMMKKKKAEKTKETKKQFLQHDLMLEKEEERSDVNGLIEKKKRKREDVIAGDASKGVHITKDKAIKAGGMKINKAKRKKKKTSEEKSDDIDKHLGELSKTKKKKRKNQETSKEVEDMPKLRGEADENEIYYISSGDEDASKGMRKWLMEYYQRRPGLKVLQQRIDEFITAHEEKLEHEKREREARASEEGWTVVKHHKGRKKTTDDSGITVGSVAPVVVQEQMAKNKSKEVGPNFYRFQRREAQRNEILMLQSKFEQDKKRIQQLRAARKFKPY